MIVLGIESSCDETGIALYDSKQGELAHRIHSQIDLHRQYGGVVPELASRDHINRLIPLIHGSISDAGVDKKALSAIAFTNGPGLLGAVMCGAAVAKSMSLGLGIPNIEIHHMEGHLLAGLLDKTNPPSFPFVALLVSGGHTLLVLVEAVGRYQILGNTLDDAVGEAFDKTAKILGLPYPGGPELAKLADNGNPTRFKLTKPMVNRPGLDFSFSGLKTQVRLLIEEQDSESHADIAAAFQKTIVDTLLIKCRRAIEQTNAKGLLISGGVGANKLLRETLAEFCQQKGINLHLPPQALCTDNGLMIAHAGALRIHEARHDYSINCRARWNLEDLSPPPSK